MATKKKRKTKHVISTKTAAGRALHELARAALEFEGTKRIYDGSRGPQWELKEAAKRYAKIVREED